MTEQLHFHFLILRQRTLFFLTITNPFSENPSSGCLSLFFSKLWIKFCSTNSSHETLYRYLSLNLYYLLPSSSLHIARRLFMFNQLNSFRYVSCLSQILLIGVILAWALSQTGPWIKCNECLPPTHCHWENGIKFSALWIRMTTFCCFPLSLISGKKKWG